MKIIKIKAREILDSRGEPTVEVDLHIEKGFVRASVPSGKSRGTHEAFELRDGDRRFFGKGVKKAIENINKIIKPELVNRDFQDPTEIDKLLLKLDGTKNKSKLGANAILAVSFAAYKAYALEKNKRLYEVINEIYENLFGEKVEFSKPTPMANIINGGKHAGNNLAIQEFMIVPVGIEEIPEKIRAICEIYYTLKDYLKKKYGKVAINVGDEGGFAPPLDNCKDALSILEKVIEDAGYSKKEVRMSLDCAASSYYREGKYHIDGKILTKEEYFEYILSIVKEFDIFSIEDPFYEEDFDTFAELTKKVGKKVLIVGDDLYTTNKERLLIGIEKKSTNSILIKPNQIGSVLETLEVINLAKKNNIEPIVSHRSGETVETFIIHLAVGTGCKFVKIGAPARGERVEKYNELLRIYEMMSSLE